MTLEPLIGCLDPLLLREFRNICMFGLAKVYLILLVLYINFTVKIYVPRLSVDAF
jgi:hypothetical protein